MLMLIVFDLFDYFEPQCLKTRIKISENSEFVTLIPIITISLFLTLSCNG